MRTDVRSPQRGSGIHFAPLWIAVIIFLTQTFLVSSATNCGTPPAADANGNVTYTGTGANDRAVYACNTGYVRRGEDTLVCESGTPDAWAPTFPPVCNVSGQFCPTNLTAPTNGSIAYSSDLRAPSTAVFSCADGFNLTATDSSYSISGSGTFSASCTAFGTGQGDVKWDVAGKEPNCTALTCPDLNLTQSPNLQAAYSPTTRVYPATVTFSCADGFVFVVPNNTNLTIASDNTTATDSCTASGAVTSWPVGEQASNLPSCSAVQCPDNHTAPTNGSLNYTNNRCFPSRAVFTCDDTFEVTGVGGSSTTDTCNATGTSVSWPLLSSPPSCSHLNECTLNTHNCHGNATCTNTHGSFTCTCVAGHNGTGVSCSDVDECALNTHDCDGNATCANSIGSFGCSCNDGYEGNGTLCAGILCPNSHTAPGNGTFYYSNNRYFPSTATFTCNDGYEITGGGSTTTDTCNATANVTSWPRAGSPPVCTAVICPDAYTAPTNGTLSYSNGRYFPSIASFTCDAGFKISGGGDTANDTCTATANVTSWPGTQPNCTLQNCPNSISAPTNGLLTYTPTDRSFPATALYACNDGYQLTAHGSAAYTITGTTYQDTCAASGGVVSWPTETTQPTCEGVACPALTAPTNGILTFSPNPAVFPANVTWSCNDGYLLTAPAGASYNITSLNYTDACTASGVTTNWTTLHRAPTCEAVICPDSYTAPVNGTFSYSNNPYFPSTATFTCNDGYEITGGGSTTTDTCSATGIVTSWPGAASPPNCTGVACPTTISAPGNGTLVLSPDPAVYPATATFGCNNGYRLTAPGGAFYSIPDLTYVDTCNATGIVTSWPIDAVEPTCEAVICPDSYTAPGNGSFFYTNNRYFPSTATFTCNAGYEITGGGSTTSDTCSATANVTSWPGAGTPPVCTALTCPTSIAAPTNGLLTFNPSSRVFPATALYECNDGYQLTAPGTATYTVSGTTYQDTCLGQGAAVLWPTNSTQPTCEGVACPTTISAPGNGTLVLSPDPAVYPATATFGCNDGYRLTAPGGAFYSIPDLTYVDTCNATGIVTSWPIDAVEPTCDEVACPVLTAATNGQISFTNNRNYPSQVTYQCNDGYVLTAHSGGSYTVSGLYYSESCLATQNVTSWAVATVPPTCDRASCTEGTDPQPNALNNTQTKRSNTPSGLLFDQAGFFYTCNNGYSLTSPPTDNGTALTEQNVTFTCTAISPGVAQWQSGTSIDNCGVAAACNETGDAAPNAFPAISSRTNTPTGTTTAVETFTYTCNTGYKLTGGTASDRTFTKDFTCTGVSYGSSTWQGTTFSESCTNIDECEENVHDCNVAVSTCKDTEGSFFCDDRPQVRCPDDIQNSTDQGNRYKEITIEYLDELTAYGEANGEAFDLQDGELPTVKSYDVQVGDQVTSGNSISACLTATDSSNKTNSCCYKINIGGNLTHSGEAFQLSVAETSAAVRALKAPVFSSANTPQVPSIGGLPRLPPLPHASLWPKTGTRRVLQERRALQTTSTNGSSVEVTFFNITKHARPIANDGFTVVKKYPDALLIPCPIPVACVAGAQDSYQSDEPGTQCIEGMKGPLCDECEDGWYFSVPGQPCEQCPTGQMTSGLIIAGVGMAFLLGAFAYTTMTVTSEPDLDMADHKVLIKQVINYFGMVGILGRFDYYRITAKSEAVAGTTDLPDWLVNIRLDDVMPVQNVPSFTDFLSMTCIAEQYLGTKGIWRLFAANMMQVALPIVVYIVAALLSLLVVFLYRRCRKVDEVSEFIKRPEIIALRNGVCL
uniref:Sushi domain-containing protein n=1 Tax=Chromera velia CCMP2878 TaxID=1169474 RepID=A0A0G4HAN7_9ALVE|eukprot:Cvel_6052.t1-p1 / transcript=Cvel_6052.t1 / gene=Cvel_6052 / organism=Chromera_velia_CCMP2878 / gene_product=Sushi, von Willebrand factor type A, EGF and, putative / transcript_product=Sushi, von Willebrand factor type A, EGF and, putative / location=Cvel_scaffold291:5638-22651(+) / protein_length=1773 / sequence_SO=supercontig / SO=protein_coding / is_pseudo=false